MLLKQLNCNWKVIIDRVENVFTQTQQTSCHILNSYELLVHCNICYTIIILYGYAG